MWNLHAASSINQEQSISGRSSFAASAMCCASFSELKFARKVDEWCGFSHLNMEEIVRAHVINCPHERFCSNWKYGFFQILHGPPLYFIANPIDVCYLFHVTCKLRTTSNRLSQTSTRIRSEFEVNTKGTKWVVDENSKRSWRELEKSAKIIGWWVDWNLMRIW